MLAGSQSYCTLMLTPAAATAALLQASLVCQLQHQFSAAGLPFNDINQRIFSAPYMYSGGFLTFVTLLLPLHIHAFVYNTCRCLFCPCRQATFATYSISSVQQAYQQAQHALYMELLLTRRKAAAAHKQQQQYHTCQHSLTQQQLQQLSPAAAAAAAGGGSGTAAAAAAAAVPLCAGEQALELQLVQLLLGLMQCELQAGHNEQAVAKIQVCDL
jgi:hypothetical protein